MWILADGQAVGTGDVFPLVDWGWGAPTRAEVRERLGQGKEVILPLKRGGSVMLVKDQGRK